MQVLHFQPMIAFLERRIFVLLQDQLGDDKVDQKGAGVNCDKKQGIPGAQGNFQAGGGTAVNVIVPDQVKGGGDQPEIAPFLAGRFLFHCGGIDLFDVDEQRNPDNRFHAEHDK